MRFLRCVRAEWRLLVPRFTRTRLGISLLALGAALVWLSRHDLEPFTVVLQAGALATVIGAGAMAGSARDRSALTLTLTHPTTTAAIATGRWLAIMAPAALLTIICAAVTRSPVSVTVAGLVASAAVGACALALTLVLGRGAALALFLFMAVAGAVAPERLVALAHPGVVRLTAAGALELGPALWHYRDIATGDWGALAHALAWSGLGVMLASATIARRRAG